MCVKVNVCLYFLLNCIWCIIALTCCVCARFKGLWSPSLQLPLWACSCEPRGPGPADPRHALQFLLSSPAHPQEAFSLYPRDQLLLSLKQGSRPPPEGAGQHGPQRLEVQSQVTLGYNVCMVARHLWPHYQCVSV